MHHSNYGFSLIELLLVITIMSILSAATVLLIKPEKQLQHVRNLQRQNHLAGLAQNLALLRLEQGNLQCKSQTIPTQTTRISSSGFNLAQCLVPEFMSTINPDPTNGFWETSTNYDSGYTIIRDGQSGTVTLEAPQTEGGAKVIQLSL